MSTKKLTNSHTLIPFLFYIQLLNLCGQVCDSFRITICLPGYYHLSYLQGVRLALCLLLQCFLSQGCTAHWWQRRASPDTLCIGMRSLSYVKTQSEIFFYSIITSFMSRFLFPGLISDAPKCVRYFERNNSR